MRALIDTNILIDYLSGVESAREELSRFKRPSISWITWMEVLVGASNPLEIERLKSFLSGFQIVAIDCSVSELAVEIRREHRIALPDAIIQASAQAVGAILVTRNTRDFRADDPGIRVPYSLP